MKAWCIWCEDGDRYPPMYKRNGMVWIHEKCANQLMDINQDIKSIKEMLKGVHPRNKKEKDRLKVVVDFIKDMEDFRKRWDNTIKMIKNCKENQ